MSFINVNLHYIWSTKNHLPLITPELKPILLEHIKSNSFKKDIFIDTMNCVNDHIHLIISLGKDQTISNIARLIKGESSNWVNKQNIIKGKFEWQDDYFAISISESVLERVRQYIINQEEHHKKKTFAEEYDEFIKLSGMGKNKKPNIGKSL